MARYRILSWRDIPTQVEASDETGAVAKRPMPKWFMYEVSRITMREGLAGTDDYLDAFTWSGETERAGDRRRSGRRSRGRARGPLGPDAGGTTSDGPIR